MLYHLVREPKTADENPSLMILLHGYGSNEQDLFSFADELPDHYYILSVRAIYPCDNGGYSWFGIDLMNPQNRIDVEQAKASQEELIKFIEEAKLKYHCAPEDMVDLCGFSQGAILSFSLALHFPEKFNKVACLSGYPEIKLLEDVQMGKDFTNLEFFISHGTQDQVIPIEWARTYKLIAEDLYLDYDYQEYIEGHGINQENYYDLMNFFSKSPKY